MGIKSTLALESTNTGFQTSLLRTIESVGEEQWSLWHALIVVVVHLDKLFVADKQALALGFAELYLALADLPTKP